MWVKLYFRRKKISNNKYLTVEKEFKNYNDMDLYLWQMRIKHQRQIMALIKD